MFRNHAFLFYLNFLFSPFHLNIEGTSDGYHAQYVYTYTRYIAESTYLHTMLLLRISAPRRVYDGDTASYTIP